MTTIPHLCVVGHPNKGKSSIVSTLTENDSVRVGLESGTTKHADTFEFMLERRVLLRLTDTPGFQRARQVLSWLQDVTVAPAERPERVRAFLREPIHAQKFPDEVALLAPIMAGAGILYVVDGVQAVSAADEAEMEILRWTGQPRMAVINPMGEMAAIDQWQRTLEQFFQWVRVFNPLTANSDSRHELLRAMGELNQGWTTPIVELCQGLDERDRRRIVDVSYEIANYWCAQMTLREPVTLLNKSGLSSASETLTRKLDGQEDAFFKQLSRAWGHGHSALERVAEWDVGSDNLMNTETWYLWGLKQKELLAVSGAAGAATGLVVDVGLGGSSLLLGALSGGIIGSVGGWWASRQLPGKRLGWLPLSRQKEFAGPVQHPNFPLVVMARVLAFTQQLKSRTHAERSALAVSTGAKNWPRQQQVQLLQWAKNLQSMRWKQRQQDELVAWIHARLISAIEQDQESISE